jgi:Ca2+-binding EF-hand superfamily protein
LFFFQFFKQDKYEKSIKEVFTILDTDESGTISLQELETLYPDSRFAQFLFDRFDSDKNGELDFQELKNFINSNELATKLLNQLQEQVIFFFSFHYFKNPFSFFCINF